MPKHRKPPRPQKPRPDFPLFPHATGRWAKKIRQKLVYFGKVATDPKGEAALAKWLDQKDDLLAGRTPRVARDGLAVADLLNGFLNAKRHLLDTGELSPSTFGDLYATCQRIGKQFGLRRLVDDLAADDFDRLRKSVAKIWGPVRLGTEVQRVRSVFKFGYDANLVDKPVRYGPSFKKPSLKTMRQNRAAKGPRMFEAAELRGIIDAAEVPMRAMVLLGINCGFGNSDIINLPTKVIDLKAAWVDFPRPKTGIPRRCPLWQETIVAVRQALDQRPAPKDKSHAGLVFLTSRGGQWGYARIGQPDAETGETKVWGDDLIGKEFRRLLKSLGMHRPGLGFYALRHTFETIGGDNIDQVAVDAIMGHAPRASDMAAVYRERIDDARLLAVVEHVHEWLYQDKETK